MKEENSAVQLQRVTGFELRDKQRERTQHARDRSKNEMNKKELSSRSNQA